MKAERMSFTNYGHSGIGSVARIGQESREQVLGA